MRKIDFIVLEYAVSDLSEAGHPFLIAVKDDGKAEPEACFYVFENWKTLILPVDDFDRSHIEDFIYELSQLRFRHSDECEKLFQQIKALSFGPVRTARVGSLVIRSGDSLQKEPVFLDRGLLLCTQEDFDILLEKISRLPSLQPS